MTAGPTRCSARCQTPSTPSSGTRKPSGWLRRAPSCWRRRPPARFRRSASARTCTRPSSTPSWTCRASRPGSTCTGTRGTSGRTRWTRCSRRSAGPTSPTRPGCCAGSWRGTRAEATAAPGRRTRTAAGERGVGRHAADRARRRALAPGVEGGHPEVAGASGDRLDILDVQVVAGQGLPDLDVLVGAVELDRRLAGGDVEPRGPDEGAVRSARPVDAGPGGAGDRCPGDHDLTRTPALSDVDDGDRSGRLREGLDWRRRRGLLRLSLIHISEPTRL